MLNWWRSSSVISSLAISWFAIATPLLAQSVPAPATPRSGCVTGYPDGRFRGDQPLSRNEFAAGLNACLEQVEQALPKASEFATREDLQQLIQRQRELNAEIKQVNDRAEQLAE
jgi:hypothetical protein